MTNHEKCESHDGSDANYRFIPNKTLRRLNRIAAKHGMNSLTDDCPVLRDGYNVPVLFSLDDIDALGWVRCMIPATPDLTVNVCLDVPFDEFQKLPLHSMNQPAQELTDANSIVGTKVK